MPRLVACHCDPQWIAIACCPICEARQLEAALTRRGLVAREHPSTDAWDALVASYEASLDCGDADDRARDAADAHRLEVQP